MLSSINEALLENGKNKTFNRQCNRPIANIYFSLTFVFGKPWFQISVLISGFRQPIGGRNLSFHFFIHTTYHSIPCHSIYCKGSEMIPTCLIH